MKGLKTHLYHSILQKQLLGNLNFHYDWKTLTTTLQEELYALLSPSHAEKKKSFVKTFYRTKQNTYIQHNFSVNLVVFDKIIWKWHYVQISEILGPYLIIQDGFQNMSEYYHSFLFLINALKKNFNHLNFQVHTYKNVCVCMYVCVCMCVYVYIYIYIYIYIHTHECWNFNSGNYLFTTDTK